MIKMTVTVFTIFLMTFPLISSAEELGRFFLSSKERQQLNYLREKAPAEVVKVEKEEPVESEEILEETVEEELEFEQEPLVKEPIELKGVVYRGKSGNTAWLNEKNTYEGGLAAINVTVNEETIGRDEVRMKLPDNVTEITLKVGETWQDANASSEEVDDNE